MKRSMIVPLTAICLALSTFAAKGDPAMATPDGVPPRGPGQRRPAERWLDTLRQQDPAEYQRLKELRHNNPDEFAAELRARLQARTIERTLDQAPRLREILEKLPPEERKTLMDTFRRLAAEEREPPSGRDSRGNPSSRRFGERRESTREHHAESPREPPQNRADIQAAYDHRTQMIEREIDRISRQLENLRQLLDERKTRRDQIIEQHLAR